MTLGRPPASDLDRSRRRVLRIAIRLFSARGFHGVAMEDIATKSGLSKRMPYYYFGSKVKLYRAVLTEVYGRIEEMETHAVEAAASPSEKLEALIKGYFGFLNKNPEFTQLVLWENLEKGRHLPGGLLSKLPILEQLKKIVHEGVASGEFRDDLDIPHLLINVMGLSFIYFSNRYSLSQALEIDLGTDRQQERALRQVRAVLLRGVQVPRPQRRGVDD